MQASFVVRAALLLLLAGFARCALAYTQDRDLEAALRASDPKALALLPAKGYRAGAADIFKALDLHVVPGSERAWCATQQRGVLKPGCYIELVIQAGQFKDRTSRGEHCGLIARWYKAPGQTRYVPTAGPELSRLIEQGNQELIDRAMWERERKVECR